MNIFVLDYDPALAAKYHCDKHVVKMVLETAQLLSNVCHLHGLPSPYKPTHIKHPCTLWAAESDIHYGWLWRLGKELAAEYTRRYGKRHKSEDVIDQLCPVDGLKSIRPFSWPSSYLEDCKRGDPVESYRAYYQIHKAYMCTWKNTEVPYWFKNSLDSEGRYVNMLV